MKRLSAVLLSLAVCACASSATPEAAAPRIARPERSVARALDDALAQTGIVTAGFGVIQNGALVWEHYYGEEAPGVPVSEATRFNVASITKTVAAETALRLAASGLLDLDAPLARDWVDPHIANDPRRDQLTARMVLNHTSGFPNWRFFRADRRLAFEHDPGTAYGYSGEGFEYLARAIGNRLGEPFSRTVERITLAPLGMNDTMFAVRREGLTHAARPVDEEGVFHGYWCRPGGFCRAEDESSAADDMLTTVSDYARFIAAVSRNTGYSAALAAERDRVQTDRGAERLVDCTAAPAQCPNAQGYGLGFEVAAYDDYAVVGHGGSDWSEQSLGYFYKPSGDGLIIFLNAPNRRTMSAMPRILEVLDPHSPFLPRYRQWLAREAEREQQRN